MVGVRIMVRNLGLNLVSGWLVVMHTYLYYFRLSLSRCDTINARTGRNVQPITDWDIWTGPTSLDVCYYVLNIVCTEWATYFDVDSVSDAKPIIVIIVVAGSSPCWYFAVDKMVHFRLSLEKHPRNDGAFKLLRLDTILHQQRSAESRTDHISSQVGTQHSCMYHTLRYYKPAAW